MSDWPYSAGRTWRSEGIPPGQVVAVDGSARNSTMGFAYLADTGAWLCGYLNPAKGAVTGSESLHAELYAICRALQDNPDVRRVLCDSAPAIGLVKTWQAGGTEPVPHVEHRHSLRLLLPGLVRARAHVRFEWVRSHDGHLLNEGADALARLASRSYTEGVSKTEVRRRAEGIAASFTAGEAA